MPIWSQIIRLRVRMPFWHITAVKIKCFFFLILSCHCTSLRSWQRYPLPLSCPTSRRACNCLSLVLQAQGLWVTSRHLVRIDLCLSVFTCDSSKEFELHRCLPWCVKPRRSVWKTEFSQVQVWPQTFGVRFMRAN